MAELFDPANPESEQFLLKIAEFQRPIFCWLRRDFAWLTSNQFDDVWQEVLVAVWRDRDHFEKLGERSPMPWLRLVARNSLVDDIRRDRTRTNAEQCYFETHPRIDESQPVDIDSPVHRISEFRKDDFPAWLGSAIEKLKPRDSELLRLRFCEGMTKRAIGKQLGIKTNTVGSRLRGILKRIERHAPADNRRLR